MRSHRLSVVAASALMLAGATCGTEESTPAAPTSTPSAEPPTTSTPATTSTSAEPVEAKDYTTTGGAGEGLYFTTGALHCGITRSITGCQSEALVKNLPECDDPDTKAPFVALVASEPSGTCTTQGVFLADPSGGKVKELPVGQTLSSHGATCEVVAVGSVRCSSPLGLLVANPQQFTLKVKA